MAHSSKVTEAPPFPRCSIQPQERKPSNSEQTRLHSRSREDRLHGGPSRGLDAGHPIVGRWTSGGHHSGTAMQIATGAPCGRGMTQQWLHVFHASPSFAAPVDLAPDLAAVRDDCSMRKPVAAGLRCSRVPGICSAPSAPLCLLQLSGLPGAHRHRPAAAAKRGIRGGQHGRPLSASPALCRYRCRTGCRPAGCRTGTRLSAGAAVGCAWRLWSHPTAAAGRLAPAWPPHARSGHPADGIQRCVRRATGPAGTGEHGKSGRPDVFQRVRQPESQPVHAAPFCRDQYQPVLRGTRRDAAPANRPCGARRRPLLGRQPLGAGIARRQPVDAGCAGRHSVPGGCGRTALPARTHAADAVPRRGVPQTAGHCAGDISLGQRARSV